MTDNNSIPPVIPPRSGHRDSSGDVPRSAPPSIPPRHTAGYHSTSSSSQQPPSIPPRRSSPAPAPAAYDSYANYDFPAPGPTPQPVSPPKTSRPRTAPRKTHHPAPHPSSTPSTPSAGARTAVKHRPRRRPHRRHRLLVALIVILLLLAWFLAAQVSWVNKRLTHDTMLSGAASSAARTWLLVGSDERDGSVNGTKEEIPGFRTDTLLVLTQPPSGSASLISIPRDSYVTVQGRGMKINAVAETFGYSALVTTVETITGTTIDHVVRVGFAGVQGIVDALDGVELCLDYDVVDPYSDLVWQAGCHTADGKTALAFARMRYADPQGDIGRAARQRQVISAIMKKAISSGTFRSLSKFHQVGEATLASLTVDEDTNAWTMLRLALAFRDATGDNGVNGTVYYTDPGYNVPDVGSCVKLADEKNRDLFTQLQAGSVTPGTIGGYTGA